jgi:hypothetical protein
MGDAAQLVFRSASGNNCLRGAPTVVPKASEPGMNDLGVNDLGVNDLGVNDLGVNDLATAVLS